MRNRAQWAAFAALGAASLVTLSSCTEWQAEVPWAAPPEAPQVAAPAVRDGVTVEQRNAMAEAVGEWSERQQRSSVEARISSVEARIWALEQQQERR